MRRLLSTAAALMALALPLAAQEMSEAERAAFRAEVRAYLLDNPEVLMEALDVLEAREAAAQTAADTASVAANAAALFADGASWVGGNPEGDVTVVEFMDYRCGYCRRAFEAIEGLVAADGNIRFVLKEYPILGEQSLLASQFAVAALQLHGPEVYKEVHDALMAMRTDVTPATLRALASELGLPASPLLAQMAGPEVAAVIDANHALGQSMGITGTPTFIFGDQVVRGAIPAEQMQAVLTAVRAAP